LREKRSIYGVGNPEGKRPLGRPEGRREVIIRMNLGPIDGVVWPGLISLRIGRSSGLF
jgi:hypothetical protein